MSDTRFVAFHGEVEASVEYLYIPKELDLDRAKQDWRIWIRDEYVPAIEHYVRTGRLCGEPRPVHLGFAAWLMAKRGAVAADVEIYEDL